VNFPGLIDVLLGSVKNEDVHLSLFSFTRTLMRVSRDELGCAVKCWANLDADAD